VPGEPLAHRRALLDEDLDESAGLRRVLPRRGALAGGELDDDVVDPDRFARLELEVAGQVVALVEQAERGDALGERGDPLLVLGRGALGHRRLGGFRLVLPLQGDARRQVRLAVAAGQDKRRSEQQGKAANGHRRVQSPGVQAS